MKIDIKSDIISCRLFILIFALNFDRIPYMDIQIIEKKISHDSIRQLAQETFGDMVKAVVDIEKQIMAVGGELHTDAEAMLLEKGSQQKYLWGINIYPDRNRNDWIEYKSLINIRPSRGIRSMEVQNKEIKNKIQSIVNLLID